MKIKDIFTIIEGSLYSVIYETEIENEFKRIFNLWNDPEYLKEFFTENIDDLQGGFWGKITVEDAIIKTSNSSKKLEKKIIEIAIKGKTDKEETLSTIFKPLYDEPLRTEEYELNKVYGFDNKSWLRIYAIRVDSNFFVISGGAIKLTRTMQEREHTNQELLKLDITKKYIQDLDTDFGY